MITRKISTEVFKEGHYFNGQTDFTFNIKLSTTPSGFEWELEVPRQNLIVDGTKYNEETGEDDEFTVVTYIDPIHYKIKLRNKECIANGQFNIDIIKIDPRSEKLEIVFY